MWGERQEGQRERERQTTAIVCKAIATIIDRRITTGWKGRETTQVHFPNLVGVGDFFMMLKLSR